METPATAEVMDAAVCWSTVIETPPTVRVIFVFAVASSWVLFLPFSGIGAGAAFSAAFAFFAAALYSFFMSFSSLVAVRSAAVELGTSDQLGLLVVEQSWSRAVVGRSARRQRREGVACYRRLGQRKHRCRQSRHESPPVWSY